MVPQSVRGVAPTGLPQTASCPPLPPSAPTGRWVCLLGIWGEGGSGFSQSLLSIHSTGRKGAEKTPGECGDPEATRAFQAGEIGEQCPRRRSSTENEEEFVGPKRCEGSCLSNCGKKRSKRMWKT